MPVTQSVQNNFIAGFKTEATGLNFPENAAVETNNVIYSLIGDVLRREGINYEANFALKEIEVEQAKYSVRWRNVGGDGTTEIIVVQRGVNLYFFVSSQATITSPISTQFLPTVINITQFQASGNVANVALSEVSMFDGNGFLFVLHPDCDPFYCTYNSVTQVITPTLIPIQVRDFVGIPEPIASNVRPTTLSNEHQYNLQNQGWTTGTPWTAVIYNNGQGTSGGGGGSPYPGPTNPFAFPQGTFNEGSVITIPIVSQTNVTSITNGSEIQLQFLTFLDNMTVVATMNIVVSSYVAPFTTVTGTIISASIAQPYIFNYADFYSAVKFDNGTTHFDSNVILATLVNVGFVQTWFTQIGNYPANSDIWFLYKTTTDTFSPSTTIVNVQQPFGPAPKGYFIMNAFNQNRTNTSGVPGLTPISTTVRPSTGCWFEGRIFYSGVNASQQPTGDEPYTTWTENIYFSQIVQTVSDFGLCYQTNDPTSENFFSILPSDGGVLTIQGSGAIYKLFPMENGLLVFAANGIWFITGSQGIGFSATDYVFRQISKVQCISGASFISVNGLPIFWNEEGIYLINPAQFGTGLNSNAMSFQAENIALGTILTYYQNIPKQSKIFARGDYDPINFVVEWVFRSTEESGISNRYANDTALCFNTVNKAFYTYSIPTTTATVSDIRYVSYPGASGTNVPDPILKYLVDDLQGNFTFAEERDTTYVDFFSKDGIGVNFDSHFISGYNLSGKALLKFLPIYVYLFLRNSVNNSYQIQGSWDYAANRNSAKWSSVQMVQDNTSTTNFNYIYRRHKIRGRGMALSFKITALPGQPFDVIGWSVLDNFMQTV